MGYIATLTAVDKDSSNILIVSFTKILDVNVLTDCMIAINATIRNDGDLII